MATIVQQPIPQLPRRGGIVGPLILIGAGVVLLLNTFGVVQWNLWGALINLWPLFLVAVGLDLLIGRRSVAGALLAALITLLLFAAGFWYVSSPFFGSGTFTVQNVSRDVGSARNAEVTLTGGVSELRITGMEDTDQLVTGEVGLARNEEIRETFEMRGDTAVYRLDTQTDGRVSFWGNTPKVWSFRLNSELPMELSVTTGVGPATLDLADLNLVRFTLHAGVGSASVTLSRSGEYAAQVDAGVGTLTVTIPEGLAARITVDSGIGAVHVDNAFARDGDRYTSAEWSRAADRVTLHINAGVGTVSIIRD